jgi:hypothetical protein
MDKKSTKMAFNFYARTPNPFIFSRRVELVSEILSKILAAPDKIYFPFSSFCQPRFEGYWLSS